ncbi:MAG: hypothetical protein ABIA04_15190 [Pseudomonadota bacterium]
MNSEEFTTKFITGLDNLCDYFDELIIFGEALKSDDISKIYDFYTK